MYMFNINNLKKNKKKKKIFRYAGSKHKSCPTELCIIYNHHPNKIHTKYEVV